MITSETLIHCEDGDVDLAAYATLDGVAMDIVAVGIDATIYLTDNQANELILKLSNAVTARQNPPAPTHVPAFSIINETNRVPVVEGGVS